MALGACAGPIALNKDYELRMDAKCVRFNPAMDADLRRLGEEITHALKSANDESKHDRRGLEEIQRLAAKALGNPSDPRRDGWLEDMLEAACAVNNNYRPTIPPHFDAFMIPVFLQQLHRPIGVGEKPAADLKAGGEGDLSKRDPVDSTFWRRPANIAAENLDVGFDREERPRIEDKVCRYWGPKETAGMNPGFEVDCEGDRVKLKFGEVSSEPFAARLFWALGFHADATDYSPGVKVAYDRRIFTEFNSRKAVKTTFTALWFIPVYTMNLQPTKDPFDYIATATLRDGGTWSGRELKGRLMNGTNFAPEAEAQIAWLTTVPANVQVRDPDVKSIGPWDYGQLDHADRRELRGAGLLAAWIGFYDTRFDNTKLRLAGPKKNPRLEHYFSDLGGGLGRTSGFLSWHGEDVAKFPWTFTAPPLDQGKGKLARPLRIVGYTPVAPTPAFAAMTIDDARWMARQIAQLTTHQIVQALTASGYDATTVKLYTEKLISRREKMLRDLGLGP